MRVQSCVCVSAVGSLPILLLNDFPYPADNTTGVRPRVPAHPSLHPQTTGTRRRCHHPRPAGGNIPRVRGEETSSAAVSGPA